MHERVKLAVQVFNYTSSHLLQSMIENKFTQAPTYVYFQFFCYLIHLPRDSSEGNVVAYIPLQIQITKKKLTIIFIINESFYTQMLN